MFCVTDGRRSAFLDHKLGVLMARVFEFKAPESFTLEDMTAERLEEHAKGLGERALEALGDTAPVGVNAVAITRTDVEVWVQWTRACCDTRERIEEFDEPVVLDFESSAVRLPARLHGTHLESQLRTVRLQGADHVAE
jgi:hypothetical protein